MPTYLFGSEIDFAPLPGCDCPMCRKYRAESLCDAAEAAPANAEIFKMQENLNEAKRRIAQLEALLDEATTQNEVLEAQLLELGTAMNEEACAARELSRQLLELSSSANMAAHSLSDLANDAYPRA